MTDLIMFRKVIFLCSALAGLPVLSACGDPNLAKTFAEIKAIKVDDDGTPSAKLSANDVKLAVNTARDLTVNQGGLLNNKSQAGKGSDDLTIAVVDPLKVPPPDDGGALDTGIAGQAAPVMAPEATIRLATDAATRFVQVGSFGSADAARNAWAGLIERYPGVERYRPAYQTVTTATGKEMVRLKVGPVSDDNQAKNLCGQLDIHDAWCAKAG